ncbi:MAG: LacI family DNA-binding transcriptional regulator [Lentisphaeria bacterium]|nr:LacI family DNA-binding transcriptional regulator [Lentisphaeria bacterium]
MPSKKITMADVAREAGCSKATVSYCISHSRPIKEETRLRVKAVIERLGYQPICDRRQVKKKFIAVIKNNYLDLEPSWKSIVKKFQQQGFLVANFVLQEENGCFAEDILQICSTPNLAGLLCFAKLDSMDIFKYCRGIPALIFQRENSMLSPITLDYRQKITIAKEHLFSLGHRQFFLLLETQTRSTGVIETFLNELEDDNMKEELFFLPLVPSTEEEQELFAALDRAYANGCRAVIALSFYYSLLIYHWIAQRGGSVPQDISVLCLENTSVPHWLNPKLSYICHPTEEIANHTVNSLLAKINNEPVKSKKFQPFLKLNGSTAPPKKD